MKDYTKYHTIFDNMSRQCPYMYRFVDMITAQLTHGMKVTDVGGGTGIFTDILQNNINDLELNFIEPSKHMLNIAMDRIEGNIYNDEFKHVIDSLQPQNMFIFMRSFYCLYETMEEYRELPNILHNKLLSGGKVAINSLGGIQRYSLTSDLSYLTVEENHIYRMIKMEFNHMVATGKFHVLQSSEFDDLFLSNRFELIEGDNINKIYRKI